MELSLTGITLRLLFLICVFQIYSHRVRTQPTCVPGFAFWYHLGPGPGTGSSCLNIDNNRTYVEASSKHGKTEVIYRHFSARA